MFLTRPRISEQNVPLRKTQIRTLTATVLAFSLVAAACGDDGEEVREAQVAVIEDDATAGSTSASASGSTSGSASDTAGSGSGSASGTAGSGSGSSGAVDTSDSTDPLGALGPYTPVSDVSIHALVSLDTCAIKDLLPKEGAIDYPAIQEIYEVGINSVKGDGSIRNIAGFARKDRDEDIWNDFTSRYGDQQWLDTLVMSAIEGTGPFEGEADLVRRQAIAKGITEDIMIAWTFHELVAAMGKAAEGNFDPDEGAPHNWDEGWAFYHGAAPDCAPFKTANSRGENFGKGTSVNDALATAWAEGSTALVDGNIAGAGMALAEIKRQITITYVQASIRYAHKVSDAVAEGDMESARIDQAEGWVRFRVIEGFVASIDPAVADTIAAQYDIAQTEPQAGAGDAVQAAIESVYEGLGISAEDVGVLES